MVQRLWWQKPLRIVQYNLQQKDAPLIDPLKIARESEEMGANCITINAGGIVAWYPSKIQFHHVNEYMSGRNMLRELLDACHAREIKVIARFDFLLAQDDIYHCNPQWFARSVDGSPIIAGAERPGNWNLLYMTCQNGGYQNEEVAIPVINEILNEYDVDGFFWNGGYSFPCWCDECREKYLKKYGKPIPENASEFEQDWLAACNTETMEKIYDIVRTKASDKLFIRYSFPFGIQYHEISLPPDNAIERIKTGNMLCNEAQDYLSMGRKNLPVWNMGMVNMKMCQKIEGIPNPILIVHTCPGMDWRHTALPVPELRYWASQAMASGSNLWITLTGIPDTNVDKRMLECVSDINYMKEIIDKDMDGAECKAQVLLLSDNSGKYSKGWASALNSIHVEFDMISHHQLNLEKMNKYPVVIISKKFEFPDDSGELFEKYVAGGGHLIVEGTSSADLKPVLPLLGIKGQVTSSEPLTATYMRVEPSSHILKEKVGETDLIQLCGKVGFSVLKDDTEVHTTWVPSFAPVNYVGMPPERASLPMSHTKVPLCMLSTYKKGKVMFLAYEPSNLIEEYGLLDMYSAIDGYLEMMLGDKRTVRFNAPHSVITAIFQKDNTWMMHFINGIGRRPLTENIPCYNLGFSMKLQPGQNVKSVQACISQKNIPYEVKGGVLTVKLDKLDVYEMIRVEF